MRSRSWSQQQRVRSVYCLKESCTKTGKNTNNKNRQPKGFLRASEKPWECVKDNPEEWWYDLIFTTKHSTVVHKAP